MQTSAISALAIVLVCVLRSSSSFPTSSSLSPPSLSCKPPALFQIKILFGRKYTLIFWWTSIPRNFFKWKILLVKLVTECRSYLGMVQVQLSRSTWFALQLGWIADPTNLTGWISMRYPDRSFPSEVVFHRRKGKKKKKKVVKKRRGKLNFCHFSLSNPAKLVRKQPYLHTDTWTADLPTLRTLTLRIDIWCFIDGVKNFRNSFQVWVT